MNSSIQVQNGPSLLERFVNGTVFLFFTLLVWAQLHAVSRRHNLENPLILPASIVFALFFLNNAVKRQTVTLLISKGELRRETRALWSRTEKFGVEFGRVNRLLSKQLFVPSYVVPRILGLKMALYDCYLAAGEEKVQLGIFRSWNAAEQMLRIARALDIPIVVQSLSGGETLLNSTSDAENFKSLL